MVAECTNVPFVLMQNTNAWQRHCLIANDERPSCLSEVTNDESYMQYLDKEHDLSMVECNVLKEMTQVEAPKRKTAKRSRKSLRPCCFDQQGQLQHLEPKKTLWYLAYAISEPECPKLRDKFRRRFRLPHKECTELLGRVKLDERFGRWQRSDATGTPSSPIELLLLGAMRYLGRGIMFDDLEEFTAIGEETHRQFFHVFVDFGRDVLFPMYIKMPTTAAEFETHMSEFNTGCLPGAGFSTDATNILLWRCTHNLKQAHIGFKDTHPARTYNLTCNHRHQILHTTTGNCARWNDKTLAIHDDFMCGIHEGKILQDVKFKMLEWEGCVGKSAIVKVKYRGAWGLVDNGYHRWPSTQAPSKLTNWLPEKRLSDWIESFRKDSECVFGILKGRFRLLKTGIHLEGPHVADSIWLTCCALHNWLLEVDGLDGKWEGELGNNDKADFREAPKAMRRLNNPEIESFGSRQHELEAQERRLLSGNNRPQPADDENPEFEAANHEQRVDNEGAIFVNSLSYQDFRSRLVTHFDIQHRRRKIVWPKRHRNNDT